MNRSSKIALVGAALLGSALLLNGCVVESTDGTDPINTNGIGGSNNYAGNGNYAGDDNGGYAGDYYGGSAGTVNGGAGGTNPNNEDFADVRFVDLIPDSSDVDICLQDAFGDWLGPLSSVSYGLGPSQFYYPTITRYVALPVGTWRVRLVDGQATTCDSPLATDQQATFEKDVGYSLVFEGYRDSFKVQNVIDRGAPQSDATGWQAVNALTDQGNVEFGLLDGSTYVATIFENLAPYTDGDSGDTDPTNLSPAFFLTTDQSLVAYGPKLDAQIGQVHAVFLHGVNYSSTSAPASTIICENATTVAERTALGVYADQEQGLFLDDSSCIYYQPNGTVGSSN